MVSSTVYDKRETLDQVNALLTSFGYTVWMSDAPQSLPQNPRLSAFENCLQAVENADCLLVIISGNYGSGRDGDDLSIFHQEVQRALECGKPCFVLSHRDVVLARALLKGFRKPKTRDAAEGREALAEWFAGRDVITDLRVLDLYDEAIQDDVPLSERRGNWAQEYRTSGDVLAYVQQQFGNVERLRGFLSTPSTP